MPFHANYKGWTLLVWKEPFVWYYRVFPSDSFGSVYPISGAPSRDTALDRGLLHLVQSVWTPETGVDTPEIIKNTPSLLDEYQRWAAWQTRYVEGKAKGLDDFQARQYADRNKMEECV